MTAIPTREQIAREADEAARTAVRTSQNQPCAYPPGSPSAVEWKASYERYLLLHSAPDAEASA